jgi:hypothetical protein
MSLVEREKDLFAGHFRGNFLGSRAWRKLCACPMASKQYFQVRLVERAELENFKQLLK